MEASLEEIESLLKIQELDKVIFRSHKALKNLPQPKEAEVVRARLLEVNAKLAKVEAMLKKKQRDFSCMEAENAQLGERLAKTQAKIDSQEGDYRSVQTWTREMEIMSERRQVLNDRMASLLVEIEGVENVKLQAEAGIDQLKGREQDLYQQFNEQGGAIKEEIASCQHSVKALARRVSPELMKLYISSVQRHGGVGLAMMADSCCDACRNPIPQNRLPEIRKNAPLAQCPSCGRLLVVKSTEME